MGVEDCPQELLSVYRLKQVHIFSDNNTCQKQHLIIL